MRFEKLVEAICSQLRQVKTQFVLDVDSIVEYFAYKSKTVELILIVSSGGFGGNYEKLLSDC